MNLRIITVFPFAVKSQPLRKTKADKIDAKFITTLLFKSDQNSSCATLLEFPSANDISNYHLTKLTNLLSKTSKGKYEKDKAIALKNLASKSISINSGGASYSNENTTDKYTWNILSIILSEVADITRDFKISQRVVS